MSKKGRGAAFCTSLNCGDRRKLTGGSDLSHCSTHLGVARGMNQCNRMNTGVVFARVGRRVGRRHNSTVGPCLYITVAVAPSVLIESRTKGCIKTCSNARLGPLHSVLASCGHAQVAHVFSANCTTMRPVGNLGVGRALDCSCAVRGSSHCCGPLDSTKPGDNSSTRSSGKFVRCKGLVSSASIGCIGAFTRGRRLSILTTCRIRDCRASGTSNRHSGLPSCMKLARPSGKTILGDFISSARSCHVLSCVSHLGCSCSSHCCITKDFHHSNDSHLSPSGH